VNAYEDLGRQQRSPRLGRDFTAEWERLVPVEAAPGEELARVRRFCEGKGVTLAALTALDTRVALRGRGPDVLLAWAARAFPGGPVTAVKYRDLGSGRRTAEPGSRFVRPLVIGQPCSSDWFLAEGETDAARLHDLVGDAAAVMVLPAGALSFEREWAALVPRGATVFLAHDADRCGDRGARKAAEVLGGRTVRLRPPTGDWCEWSGDRQAFIRFVAEAKQRARSRVRSYDELLAVYLEERSGPQLEPVRLGFGTIDAELRGVSAGQVLGIAARTAVGKTFALGSVAHAFAARRDAGSLVLSLEMPATEWAERQLAIHADVAPEVVEARARQGTLGALAEPFLAQMRNALVIDEALALADLSGAIIDARERLDVPLRLVLIDYLGLLGAEGKDAYERASALGRGLKQFAKAEQVAVVVAMQVSRAAGDGADPVTLAMLRDSGVLEESLDFLLGCWRPGKSRTLEPAEARDLRDVMRVAILKNRKGPDGRTVDLRFHPESRRLYEPAEEVG
jgi:DnaB-like helicase C terminal domain